MTGEELRTRVVQAAQSQVGSDDATEFYRDTCGPHPYNWPKHWCGIFALWCLHQAGLAAGVQWVIGKGFLYKLKTTKSPKPGDIAYFTKYQHHAVVESVEGTSFTSIDGNGGALGGEVVHRRRELGAATAFYSIEPFLAEAVGVSDTEPAPPPDVRTIRLGDQGDDVALWQKRLLAEIEPGKFDAITEAATKSWQKSHGLKDDGEVGPKTRAKAGIG